MKLFVRNICGLFWRSAARAVSRRSSGLVAVGSISGLPHSLVRRGSVPQRHRGAIIDLSFSNPDLPRRYTKYLLQHYRRLRSAFHLPNADEVELVLEQLILLDPSFQRVYRMHMAELAWYRGDDERFLELAEQSFDPDAERGAANYDFDELAPYRTLALWIETYWRRRNIIEAWKVCRQAVAGNYLEENAVKQQPALNLAFRKTQRAMFLLQNPPPKSS